jgi:peptidyl-prolyl cis-trans isomerase D
MFYLDRYRKQIGGRFSGVLLLAIVLSFAFWGVSNYFTTAQKSNRPARVNGQTIYPDRVHLFYDQYKSVVNKKEPFTVAERNQLFQKFLADKAILSYSYEHGFDFLPNLSASMLIKQTEKRYHVTLDATTYKRLQSRSAFSETARLDSIQDQLMKQYLIQGIEKTNFVLPGEWQDWHNYLGQTRDIVYTRLHPDAFNESMTVDPKQVDQYYQLHKLDFMQQERVRLQYVVFRPIDVENTLHPSEQTLYDYYLKQPSLQGKPVYQVNLKYIEPDLNPVKPLKKKQLDEIVLSVSDPDFIHFFNENKRNLSVVDVFTKKWVNVSDLPSIFRKIQSSDLGLGAQIVLNDPLHQKRWYQLKILSVKHNLRDHYHHHRTRIKQAWLQQQVNQQFAERQDEIADWIFEHNGDLSATADHFHLQLKTSAWLEKGAIDPNSVFHEDSIQKLIFSDDFKHNHWTSEPQTLSSGGIVLFRLVDHKEPQVKPFSTVSNQIAMRLKQDQAKQHVNVIKKRILNAFKKHYSIDKIARDLHLSWKSKTIFAYSLFEPSGISDNAPNWLNQYAFQLPSYAGAGAVFQTKKTNSGVYWVVAIKQINPTGKKSSSPLSLDRFKRYLKNVWGRVDLDRYSQYALKHSTFRFD